MKDILPKPLSGVIGVALQDLKTIEGLSDRYLVNMHRWHERVDFDLNEFEESKGRCMVCFAGAVISQSLKGDYETRYHPYAHDPTDNYDYIEAEWPFSEHDRVRIKALDHLRSGDLGSALEVIGLDPLRQEEFLRVFAKEGLLGDRPDYDIHPVAFKEKLRKYQYLLKRLGE